jgi:two-component system alkaline phosphatase synthesis response regulator PhoP
MQKKKILIVDDEPNIRLLLTRMLSNDYTILEATDGQEAVDLARDLKPDLILMDLLMPRMDGYTACSVIKTDPTTGGIPVVMLTAVGFELNKQLAERVGASGYITKPFALSDIIKTISPLFSVS